MNPESSEMPANTCTRMPNNSGCQVGKLCAHRFGSRVVCVMMCLFHFFIGHSTLWFIQLFCRSALLQCTCLPASNGCHD